MSLKGKASTLAAAAAIFAVADGHICMWSPPQRGGAFEIVEPGQSICYLKQGPCGNVASGSPLATLTGGQSFDVLFQQNLNHFFQENPGTLRADFAENENPAEEDFYPLGQPIADWNGMNMITQTNFTLPVVIPNIDCEHCVLRMRYVSQNPTEDHGGSPTFHQCADVKIVKSVQQDSPAPIKHDIPNDYKGSDCCAPKTFTLQGYETSNWRNPTKLTYFFDSFNELFRIDSDSGNGKTPKDGKFQMFNDFKAGIEYYYNVNTDVCELYGLNLWYDWCYGAVNSQVYKDSGRVGDDAVDIWGMSGNDFIWTNTINSCTPISKVRLSNGESTYYYNMQADTLPEGYFDLPASCVSARNQLGAGNLTLSTFHHGSL